ncbi:MAG: hypothetical protein ACD_16C00091G0002 [uncultured bacterium]|nr:MAG: hypothetical protein ACD_16C00091G0002 [uncultured bacterium]
MKRTYEITLRVTVNETSSNCGKNVPQISFRGWGNRIKTKENRLITTEPIIKNTSGNMKKLGEKIFLAAKQMYHDDRNES